jgi:hypothetical protein
MTDAIRGWDATFCRFKQEELSSIVSALNSRFKTAGDAQVRAWNDSIPRLQYQVRVEINQSSIPILINET